MQLATWMKLRDVDDEALAAKVGVHRSTISRIRRKKQIPEYPLARKIQRATGGKVRAVPELVPL